jgi:hypothetical protein
MSRISARKFSHTDHTVRWHGPAAVVTITQTKILKLIYDIPLLTFTGSEMPGWPAKALRYVR